MCSQCNDASKYHMRAALARAVARTVQHYLCASIHARKLLEYIRSWRMTKMASTQKTTVVESCSLQPLYTSQTLYTMNAWIDDNSHSELIRWASGSITASCITSFVFTWYRILELDTHMNHDACMHTSYMYVMWRDNVLWQHQFVYVNIHMFRSLVVWLDMLSDNIVNQASHLKFGHRLPSLSTTANIWRVRLYRRVKKRRLCCRNCYGVNVYCKCILTFCVLYV